MSNTLLIRHLSGNLQASEREDLLKNYGAHRVWFINPRSHTAFASFPTKEAAAVALQRLHQLEIAGRRLTVEYATDKIITKSGKTMVTDTIITQSGIVTVTDNYKSLDNAKHFINQLNAVNHQLDFTQPPPPNLSYKYPDPNPQILFNIMYALSRNIAFYTQTLHLMNKMNLEPPFCNITTVVKDYIQSCLCNVGISLPKINSTFQIRKSSEEESELSCDGEDTNLMDYIPAVKKVKRNSNLKKINKKIKLQYPPPNINKVADHKKVSPNEVFEDVQIPKVNRIEIIVNPALNDNTNISNEFIEPSGTIGKMILKKPEIPNESNDNVTEIKHIITTKELLSNKISLKDMQSLPVFKNYQMGTPSMRLYIKNLAKDVSTKDIEGIYERYINVDNAVEANSFDVRVMQEGRMKGQAFVTLPSIEICEKALNETNGFILKSKPMVVQFARTANK